MAFLTAQYDLAVVGASLGIAFLASYVALDLTERIRANDGKVARAWWMGGSVVMGTGIWAMHFVGMLAFELPMPLGYTGGLTLLSWFAAAAVSGLALGLTASGTATPLRIGVGALAMGGGICAMHYIGMSALAMAPGIVWNPLRVAASAVIAVGASAAALLIFLALTRLDGAQRKQFKLLAAIVMGLAISGMHYTGMSAAGFVDGSICLSAGQLGGSTLGVLVMLAAASMLLLTMFTSMLDARMQDRTTRLAASLKDANTQLRTANDELHKRAFQDPLTGLANRMLFEDRLSHAQSRGERGGKEALGLAVLFVDLDGFKPVNDSLGHAAGDHVLKEVAERLAQVARKSDTVARIGGDEFVLLLEDLADPADASAMAKRLIKAMAAPFQYMGRSLHLYASVGVAIYPEHGRREDLLASADAAMYTAKRNGGNTYVMYEPHMNSTSHQQLTLQSDLRDAITHRQFTLQYQPKFDSKRSRLRGVEALLRWKHPERGNVPPGEFIPIAERYGLIDEIGDWVVDEACRQMREWQDQGLRMPVAINLSVHQLRAEDLGERIRAALERHRIGADCLLCEITETVAMKDIEATQKTFRALQDIGVFLSIDDFGTGYSSLSYLRQMPAQQLKIDRSFVNDLEASEDARAVVDAVIKLAHALDLHVVAEGVETEGQRDILVALGCDQLQGYYFAHPVPAAQILDWAMGQRAGDQPSFSNSLLMADVPV